MRAYIKKLQSKKEESRRAILVGALTLSMCLVGFVWIESLSSRFNADTSAKTAESIKPFALFANSLSDTFSDISASVGSIGVNNTDTKEKQVNVIPIEPQQ